jgi:gliding motility-associated-like protein
MPKNVSLRVMLRRFAAIWFFTMMVFSAKAGEPTVPASNPQVGALTCIAATLTFTKGDGAWRTVLMKQGSAVDVVPADGTKYTAFSAFGAGSQIGTGNYVVYDNIANSVTITGLVAGSTYHFAVFEHDGIAPNYLTSNFTASSFTTHSLKLDFSFNRTDSCEKTNKVTFTNKSQASFGWITYTWLYRDGNKDTGVNASYTYNAGGSYAVQLIASPSLGCNNTYTTPTSVFIVPRPRSNPTVRNWDTAQCLKGNHFYFEDKTTIPAIPRCGKRVMWYLDKSDSTTFPNPDKFFSNPGKYRIFFRSETTYGLNGNVYNTGCTDTSAIYIRVIADPSSGVGVNDSVQCLKNNLFSFENKSSGLVWYRWYFGDGDSAVTPNASHAYSDTGTYMVIHSARSKEGCSSTDTLYVKVRSNLSSTFSGLPSFVCENAPAIKLMATTPGGKFSGGPVLDSTFTCSPPGNYTIKYVVPDADCPDSSTAAITIHPLPKFNLGRDTNLCNGSSLILSVLAPGSIAWSTGQSINSITVSSGGTFKASVNDLGCLWEDSLRIFLGDAPLVTLPSDTLLCRGGMLKLTATWPQSRYLWNTGQTDSVIYVTKGGSYSVTVTNPCGIASDAVTVRYQEELCDLFIPTAFTPNNDDKNNDFQIFVRGGKPTLMLIYDRWGGKVFDSRDKGIYQWNGRTAEQDCIEGVYHYVFQYEMPVGIRVRRNSIKGSLMLLR